ncbi:hypothetical protein VOLCADRAFT_121106 [Volvox carteri f. nagariensis]|uniref:SET domain-containing protein n=1 Tax=Volvox carteri f. nagariensis TaxID=3068 RepID=D8U2H0_VOLCA|nr:uncharacterized protein VOLCADRAFT_121106 [Volvox carteri f. nagariensis]EFJ46131.1 hypothetical protein VOLCADRAFT_121106 [Volvox carteri f. nagariensis]|eukprot:XP_002952881.1 hypothetical protein VOLCADRAFT_121106 [Volvox carteri f. nagariensis]
MPRPPCPYPELTLRLRGAATASSSSSADPLPWDVLQALALLDGLAGDGGEFWQVYCDALLPAPELLTLPMCWEGPRLAELQHADIANAARAQQARLSSLFPMFMEPLAPDVPSWFQWAFACVRSRAFRVGPDAFAFVPFLDFANHADAPPNGTTVNGTSPLTANADFRLSPATTRGTPGGDNGGGSDDGVSYFELVALRDVAPGGEVTICYCGPEGYTNQRFMAQYGFVPRGGNPADRIKLDLESVGPHPAPLELSLFQDLLGDALFLGALRGSDPYLLAALKSLPLKDDNDDGDCNNDDDDDVGAGGGGRGASMRTAAVLLSQVESQLAECTTPLEADEELLSDTSGEQLWAEDPRLAAAVSYRVERKRLLDFGFVVIVV